MLLQQDGLDVKLEVLGDALTLKVKRHEQPKILFNAHFSSITCYGVESMSIKAGQSVQVSIDPRDQFKNVAKLDGTPVWNLVGEGLGSLQVAQDGLAVVFISSGLVGSATVEVAADVDLSDGVRNLGGSVVIDIEAGEAVDLGVRAEPIVLETAPITPEAAVAVAEAGVASPDVVIVDVLPEVPVGEVAPTTEVPVTEAAPTTEAPVADVVDVAPVATESTETPVDPTAGTTEQPIV